MSGRIQPQWLLATLNDAQETLAKAISLIEEDPRKATGVLEHEITELYAKLNYAVNTACVGPDALNTMDHDSLIAWPESMPFGNLGNAEEEDFEEEYEEYDEEEEEAEAGEEAGGREK